jgi:site-specific recombinase XerD
MGELIRYNADAWEGLKALVLDSVASPHSKRAYSGGLDAFLSWYRIEFRGPVSKAVVHAYKVELERSGLSASTINQRLAAIRKLVSEAADNGLISGELAAGVARVKGTPRHGIRIGNWLDRQQAEQLLNAPDRSTITGKRDRAILAVLIGCGLRRSEAAGLDFRHIQRREGRWVIVDLIGKHGRIRSVPMPDEAKAAINDRTSAAGIRTGRVFRPINKGGRLTHESLTEKCIWSVLRKYAAGIGLPNLAPHDLRRSYAKLARQGGASLEQIQLSLGHASVQTTEIYLGSKQDLKDAPCDHLRLNWEASPSESKKAA